MQKEAYDQLYQVENSYWYHDSRRKLVEIYLRCIRNKLSRTLKILDVGSGTGGMFNLLRKYGEVTGLELSDYAVELSHRKYPDITIKIGSANNLLKLFPESSFDLITFFNVLYHKWITDDYDVLRQAADTLRPGGYLILNEPAFMCLFRNFDRFSYGIRRYSQNKISKILYKSGFRLVKSTYFNSIGFIPLFMSASLQRVGLIEVKDASNEMQPLPYFINECFKGVMLLERIWIITFGKMPFGISLLCIAKKS